MSSEKKIPNSRIFDWINSMPDNKDSSINEDKDLNNTYEQSIISNKKIYNPFKRYSITAFVFVIGIIFVSVVKNETRNLEREIDNLQAHINAINFDLDQATLDHNAITSPDNISKLANKYLNEDFKSYKKSQIYQLDTKIFTPKPNETKSEKNNYISSNVIKSKAKKIIENKKKEIKTFYSDPKSIPKKVSKKVSKEIDEKKSNMKKIYTSPKSAIKNPKVQKWAAVQVVKVFLGIPVVPVK
jgi:hypothetical protein